MKKLKALLLCLALALSSMPAVFAAGEWTGSGTEADPYIISTAAGLQKLADDVNGGEHYAYTYFKLANDIDLTGYKTLQIGAAEDSIVNNDKYTLNFVNATGKKYFSGIFDGDGYTIKNYNYSNGTGSSANYGALFAAVYGPEDKHAVIKNLTITGSRESAKWLASIVGLGQNLTIENCVNKMTLKNNAWEFSGGIVATLYKGEIKNCINYGDIDLRYSKGVAGGIVGYTKYVTITDCINYGNINIDRVVGDSHKRTEIGGIVGVASFHDDASYLNIYRCVNRGNITAATGVDNPIYIAGLVGYGCETLTMVSCANTGNISVASALDTGGLIGKTDNPGAYIYDCYNTGNGGQAGLVGSFVDNGQIYNCYSDSTNPSPAFGWSAGNTSKSNVYIANNGYSTGSGYTLVDDITTVVDTLNSGKHHAESAPWTIENGKVVLAIEPAAVIKSADKNTVRFSVSPVAAENHTTIVALYDGNKLVDVKIADLGDTRADFNANSATKAKVFVWGDSDEINSLGSVAEKMF